MEIGIMTAVALFIATALGIFLTKEITLSSFIIQGIPMIFSAIFIAFDLAAKIGQGAISGQLGYILIGTVIVITVTIFNRSIFFSENTYKEAK